MTIAAREDVRVAAAPRARVRRRRLRPARVALHAFLAVAALLWLAAVRRRRAGRKYEGLRILR